MLFVPAIITGAAPFTPVTGPPLQPWPRSTAPVSNDPSKGTAGVPGAPSPIVQVNYAKGYGPGVGYHPPQLADNIPNATLGIVLAGQTFVPR